MQKPKYNNYYPRKGSTRLYGIRRKTVDDKTEPPLQHKLLLRFRIFRLQFSIHLI